jgi:hypothetical protein
LQTLIQEALGIRGSEGPGDDDLRTFELIEELVWQHAGRATTLCQSVPSGSAAGEQDASSSYAVIPPPLEEASRLCEYNHADVPQLIDEIQFEALAKRRLDERIAEAQKRYLFELASMHAANKSIRRMVQPRASEERQMEKNI